MTPQECSKLNPGDVFYNKYGSWQVCVNDTVKQEVIVTHLESAEGTYSYSVLTDSVIGPPAEVSPTSRE